MPRFKVHFIGSEYESMKYVLVNAFSKQDAFMKAEELYKIKGWDFKYYDLFADLSLN